MPVLLLLALACSSPGPSVVSAEEIGVVEQSPDIQGRDGGPSARIFGRSVWTYGDTVLEVEDERGTTWHHNSVSWTEDSDASDGLSGFQEPLDSVGAPAHLIPPSTEEQAFIDAHSGDPCEVEPCGARWAVWPGAPLWDEEGQQALIFYGLIYAEPGEMNFTGVGQSVATWTGLDQPVQRPVLDPEAEHPDLLWTEGEPGYGAAAVIEDGQVYALECDGSWHPCSLGRAPVAQVQVREAWSYWDGAEWVDDWRDAATLFDGAPILSLHFCEHLEAWLVVYSPPFSKKIVARTAPQLTGPWSRESLLYRVQGEDAPYDVVAHAEYAEDEGRVQYLTWSRGTDVGWFGTEFALLRVELE